MYQFQLDRFQGPLDLLLQLIENEELSIAEVSLAQVTEQYLAYLDQATDLSPDEMADFLVVAAKLLLIKSRVLLPQLFGTDDDEVGEDLTRQLALYKMYVEAGRYLSSRLRARKVCYGRERRSRLETVTFSPPPQLHIAELRKVYTDLLHDLEAYVRPAPELISRAISLKERISALRSLLETNAHIDFHQHILAGATSRTDIIISFLALLELVKQRYVVAHQQGHGMSIAVSKMVVVEESA